MELADVFHSMKLPSAVPDQLKFVCALKQYSEILVLPRSCPARELASAMRLLADNESTSPVIEMSMSSEYATDKVKSCITFWKVVAVNFTCSHWKLHSERD